MQECEYCRLNSGCFLNETETEKCQDLCGSEYTPNATQFIREYYYHDSGLRSYHLLNYYGQISFSQFIGKSIGSIKFLILPIFSATKSIRYAIALID